MAAPRWHAALAAALLCASRLASGAPPSALGDAGSQGHSEAPFKLLSTTPGSGNGADDGKVTATPWDIVVLTLTGVVVLTCCGLGMRRMLLQSAKDAAAMQEALAALGADREAAGGDDDPAAAPRSGRSRERRGERVPSLPAGERQLPQYSSRARGGSAASSVSQQSRIPAWRDDEVDAALAASEAADVELVPMYTFTPERTADGGEWFVAPLAHLPARPRDDANAPRRQRRERRRERDAPPPEPLPPPPPPQQQDNVWRTHFGWG